MTSKLRHLRLLLYSIRYSRPSQLAARFFLVCKRRFLNLRPLAAIARSISLRAGDHIPSLKDRLIRPVFAPRKQKVRRDGDQISIILLNNSISFETPFDWHPAAGKKNNQLERMNLHYMEYLEAFEDKIFSCAVRDWIRQNPPYTKEYWMESWNSYCVSIRPMVWMQQFALRKERLDLELKEEILGSIYQQIRFLVRNLELDLKGNHLIKNCKALIWAGSFFSGRESEGWLARGIKILNRELKEQILPDGLHYERSPAYHLQVFAGLLECYRAIDSPEEKKELAEVLRRMAAAAVNLTHPDGLISLFNDGGLHMGYGTGEVLAVYNELIGPIPDPDDQIKFAAAGYYGYRDGGDYLLVDCGEIGPDYLPAHGHGDLLAFEWDLGGKRVIVDAGVCEYYPGEMRSYSRSTRAHNTLTVADADQCEFWKAFRVGRRARPRVDHSSWKNGVFIFEGAHDGFRYLDGNPIHIRRIEAGGNRLNIEDRVDGGAGQDVKARFLCHPDNDLSLKDNVCYIKVGDIEVRMETTGLVEIQDAWYMPDFGVRRPAKQIVVSYGDAPCGGSVYFKVSEND